ncbi:hypothetical protein V1506DRAFT_566817 [Lipomyces tetrasporus]
MSNYNNSYYPSHNAPQAADEYYGSSAPEVATNTTQPAQVPSPTSPAPLVGLQQQQHEQYAENAGTSYLSELAYDSEKTTKSHRKAWIVGAVVAIIVVAVGLGVGLGVGLTRNNDDIKSTGSSSDGPATSSSAPPAPTATPIASSSAPPVPTATPIASSSAPPVPTETTVASSYCVSDSNIVKSPRFTNASTDWTIANGIYHFEPLSWKDGSPAGLFLPGLGLSQSYDSYAYANQTISGLTAGKEYSLAFAYTALTFAGVPADWPWDTFNLSVAATRDVGGSSGANNVTTSTIAGLDTTNDGSFSTRAFAGGTVSANPRGEIYVAIAGLGFGVDLFIYYVSVYDPADNSCNYESDMPVFYYDQLDGDYVSFHTRNATIADSYCVPESNVVDDPRFTTVGSDQTDSNSPWTVANNLTFNFVPAEFADNSPAGVILPYVDDPSIQPAIDGNQATLEQNLSLAGDADATYRVMFSYQYILRTNATPSDGAAGFYVRLRLANSSDFDSALFDYSVSPDATTLTPDSIYELNYRFESYDADKLYVRIEALSYLYDISMPRVTVYLDSDWSCNAGDYYNVPRQVSAN